jgi:hypothetical protein
MLKNHLDLLLKNIIAKKNFDAIFTPLFTRGNPGPGGYAADGQGGLPMIDGDFAKTPHPKSRGKPRTRIFYETKGEYREWKKKISCTWKVVWVS